MCLRGNQRSNGVDAKKFDRVRHGVPLGGGRTLHYLMSASGLVANINLAWLDFSFWPQSGRLRRRAYWSAQGHKQTFSR